MRKEAEEDFELNVGALDSEEQSSGELATRRMDKEIKPSKEIL